MACTASTTAAICCCRSRCGVGATWLRGIGLLLAADLATGVLVGHCFAVLDQLLAGVHAALTGGEAA